MEINPEFNNILADAIAKQNEAERIQRENTEIVVRCKDCIHSRPVPGEDDDPRQYMCVHDAEYYESTDTWYGFVAFHDCDFFCAGGIRRGGHV